MVGPPRINTTVHNQLDMLWDRSIDGQPQEKHSPKRRTVITLLSFVLLFLVILGAVFLPGFLSSRNYGDVSQAKIVIPDSDAWDDTEYPSTYTVGITLDLVKSEFHKSYQGCTLLSLSYDKELSDSLQETLNQKYQGNPKLGSGAFVITGTFSTGNKKLPEGLDLSPNTTYSHYYWVVSDYEIMNDGGAILYQGVSLP